MNDVGRSKWLRSHGDPFPSVASACQTVAGTRRRARPFVPGPCAFPPPHSCAGQSPCGNAQPRGPWHGWPCAFPQPPVPRRRSPCGCPRPRAPWRGWPCAFPLGWVCADPRRCGTQPTSRSVDARGCGFSQRRQQWDACPRPPTRQGKRARLMHALWSLIHQAWFTILKSE